MLSFFKKVVLNYKRDKLKELEKKKIQTKIFEKIVTLYHKRKNKENPKTLLLKSLAKAYNKRKLEKRELFLSLVNSYQKNKIKHKKKNKSLTNLFIKIVEKYKSQKKRNLKKEKKKSSRKKEKKKSSRKKDLSDDANSKKSSYYKNCVDFFYEEKMAKKYFEPFPAPSRHLMFNDTTNQIPYYVKSYFHENSTEIFVVSVKKSYKKMNLTSVNRIPKDQSEQNKGAMDIILNPMKLLTLKPPKKFPPREPFEETMQKFLSIIKNVKLYHNMNLLLIQLTVEQVYYQDFNKNKTQMIIGDISGVVSNEFPDRLKFLNRYVAPEVRNHTVMHHSGVIYAKEEKIKLDEKADIFPLGILFIRMFAGDHLVGFTTPYMDHYCKTLECYNQFMDAFENKKFVALEDEIELERQENEDFFGALKENMEKMKKGMSSKSPTPKKLMQTVLKRKLKEKKEKRFPFFFMGLKEHEKIEYFVEEKRYWYHVLIEFCKKMIAFEPEKRPTLKEVEEFIKELYKKGKINIEKEGKLKAEKMKKEYLENEEKKTKGSK